ncbi:MAG: ribosome biogenesis GTPase Der [Thiotrichales bacterium]
MKAAIALVGRPNVGKSTLFNQLTRSRDAIVANFPGLTRDRQYGIGKVGGDYLVIDTGGLAEDSDQLDVLMASQTWRGVEEADKIIWLVDCRAGLTAADEVIAQALRESGKPVVLAVNKTDGVDPDVAMGDFYRFGFEGPYAIAAAHGRGIQKLMEQVLAGWDVAGEDEAEAVDDEHNIRLAFVGRPNVGKSTLVNRILGEERVVVSDVPGTTRDSIEVPFERDEQGYTLIDTAGVRRRGKVKETVEKFSIVKTLGAIEAADVVVNVLDAHEGITEQDVHLIGLTLQAGRPCVVLLNKWDGLDPELREKLKAEYRRQLPFLDFAEMFTISALHGTGVGLIFDAVKRAWKSARVEINTTRLTRLLEAAVARHQPPLVRGRRIKLRYAHQGGRRPPVIVIHGNQTDKVPMAYKRYLINFFRQQLKLTGTPIRLEFKTGENPYADKRNKLTPRQQRTQQKGPKKSRKAK